MTTKRDQQVIARLIREYEAAIEYCKDKKFYVIVDYLNEKFLRFGVCSKIASYNYKYYMYDQKSWIQSFCKGDGYWTKTPQDYIRVTSNDYSTSRELKVAIRGIIRSLEKRLEILKSVQK